MQDQSVEMVIKVDPRTKELLDRYVMAYNMTPGALIAKALEQMLNPTLNEEPAPTIDFGEIRKKLSQR